MSEELINQYMADEREATFLLFEQFRLQDLFESEVFSAFTEEDSRLILSEALKFTINEVGPIDAYADRIGCKHDPETGKVTVPPLLRELQRKYIQNGWHTLLTPEEYGGQGAPYSLAMCVLEFFIGGCSGWVMYNQLTQGAAHLIHVFGTDDQKALFCPKLHDREWLGTMCLTEPGAGSEVGRTATRAVKNDDGTYSITGVKSFISGGDHDLTDNIVHMVLGRIEDAPGGTRGLSLFIIPKMKVAPDGTVGESNDVICRGIEKKMGIHVSATATLNFGDNGNCIGYLLGSEENKGISQMFQLMNESRIGTGVQALSSAASAYMNALAYSRERVQGKLFEDIAKGRHGAESVRIIEHEDVRRMLMEMRSRIDGCRAIALKLGVHIDRARAAGDDKEKSADEMEYVELLTPLVKAYLSDEAFRVTELAIQCYGGYGYIQDYPVERYCRDVKIQSLYEGTNYIQALDLVGRKLNQDGGRLIRRLMTDVGKFIKQHEEHEVLAGEIKGLAESVEALTRTTMKYLSFFQSGQLRQIPLTATRYLSLLAEVTTAWLLLEGAVISHTAMQALSENDTDFHFYAGKIHTARYFVRNILPGVKMKAEIIASEDTSALDITERQFPQVGSD